MYALKINGSRLLYNGEEMLQLKAWYKCESASDVGEKTLTSRLIGDRIHN